jgi:flagellar biosynthesis anti-sigma factor FlgM
MHMDIRNSLDGLKSLLGVSQPAQATPAARGNTSPASGALGSDHATLSSAGSEVLQSAGEDGVRMEKVTGIQAALQAGTYSVSPVAVASKMVEAMLSGQ